jgi:MoaA/NifB/PqqE/SkfB family radical SAM enzyme
MPPRVAVFFKEYLSNEKVIEFNGRSVLNTHFPPYPSGAFDNFAEHITEMGSAATRWLFSVTLAVTNRCNYRCWHCYNAGRNQHDVPLSILKNAVRQLKELGVVNVTLTGGEPLLRADLEEAARAFGENAFLNLNTTGYGLTPERAQALCDSGIFGVGISLDSLNPAQHDRMRGREGAFQTALDALQTVADDGMYPYIIAVATHEFLQPERFWPFIKFASEQGARCICSNRSRRENWRQYRRELNEADKQLLLDYQKTIARDESLPILSCFLYLESSNAFGCGAGLTHLYIDGSGEVCPCNFVPLSFGNIADEPLVNILDRMGCYFCKPRTECVGQLLSRHISAEKLPLDRRHRGDMHGTSAGCSSAAAIFSDSQRGRPGSRQQRTSVGV